MAEEVQKPTLVLDFDGVIHSYTSGWKGPRVIPDPPVPGAIQFLLKALDHYQVCVLSSRSHQWGGRRAMKSWLKWQLINWILAEPSPGVFVAYEVIEARFDDYGMPFDMAVMEWADDVVNNLIKWPLFKPAAHVVIDDRAITFRGVWPEFEELKTFKPWNKEV